MKTVSNIRVGTPEVSATLPSHVPGVREGNERGSLARERGIHPRGRGAWATPERSTGINPDNRTPILPGSPVLSPA
jgi:hypothetical protein